MNHMIELLSGENFTLKEMIDALPSDATPGQVTVSACNGRWEGDSAEVTMVYLKPFTPEELAKAQLDKEHAELVRKARLERTERDQLLQLQAKYGAPK